MTQAISSPRRTIIILILAQATLGAQMPMLFIIAGLAGQSMASNICFATMPISMIIIGSMCAATPISSIMQRYGRRSGFWIGTTGGALGGLIGAIALYYSNFPLFLFASFCTGFYMSAQGFYRFAAADTADEAFRPKAISYVMAGGLAAAIIGPQMVKATNGIVESGDANVSAFMGAYIFVFLLNVVGSLIFLFINIPAPAAPDENAPAARSRIELLKTPRIAVAMICGMVSYALMNLVMTSTPLAVVGCGYTTNNAADIVSGHVLAMFIPSFFTGHLIARFGVEKIVGAGLVILAAAGVVALNDVELENFFVALILLGIGWNFGFIGATAMLTSAHGPRDRGRVQGMNDLFVFGGVTMASLASGGLMNCSGGNPVQGWTAVNLAMIPFLLLAGSALIWLMMRPKDPLPAT